MSPLQVDWFDPFYAALLQRAGGRLGMSRLPGTLASAQLGEKHGDVVADVEALRNVDGCDAMVLLVQDKELDLAGVSGLPELLAERGIRVLRFPIPDGGVPTDRASFRRFLDGVIRRLLAGATVVVACREGPGRTGLTVACLLRDLTDMGPGDAIEGARIFHDGTIEAAAQEAFVVDWNWPRRRPVARALAERRREKAAEQAIAARSMSPEDIAFERLFVGLRQLLRPEELESAYLVRPELARPAAIVCFLVHPADPQRLVRLVRARARGYGLHEADLKIEIGPPEGPHPVLYRVVPAPPDRLGA